MENINSLRHVGGHVGTAELLPDTSAACGHSSSRAMQMSGCRLGGEGRMENAVTETNGGKARGGVSRLTMHLAGWRCKGDSNNSNSSIMG